MIYEFKTNLQKLLGEYKYHEFTWDDGGMCHSESRRFGMKNGGALNEVNLLQSAPIVKDPSLRSG